MKAKREPTQQDIDVYIRKWLEALEPLLRKRGPAPVEAVTAEAEPTQPPTECEPGFRRLSLSMRRPVDFLVAVDTSGSMYDAGLQVASEFLGALEHGLVRSGADYRIVVLAEPVRLQLGDAGVALREIGSHDGLEVLLASAMSEQPRWLSMVRSGADLRIVLITDDRPLASDTKHYLDALAAVVGPKSYTFSVLGGFDVASKPALLWPSDPLSAKRCIGRFSGKPPAFGVNPGLVYQSLAVATGGFRGSLCSEESRLALAEALLGGTGEVRTCAWHLGGPARHIEAQAILGARRDFLVREYATVTCAGMRRSYLLDGPKLSLCPDTCDALGRDGFGEVEVHIECDR